MLVPFLLSRTLLLLIGLGAAQLFPAQRGFHTPHSPLIDAWVRWDALHYLGVATEGYGGSNDAFFPLYPWSIRALGAILPVGISAVLIAQAATLGACVALYRWSAENWSVEIARDSVWMLLLFPTSFFLGAAYAESLYLLFAVAALATARRHPILAFGFVLLACLCRPQGFLCLTLPFGVAWLIEDRSLRRFPFFALGSVFALGILMFAHQQASGDPLGFLHGDTLSGLGFYREADPTSAPDPSVWAVLLDEGLGPNLARRVLNWFALALCLFGGIALLRRRRVAEGLLVWLTVGVPLFFHASIFDAASMARYALVAFPLFPLLAEWVARGPLRRRAVELSFPMVQVTLFSLYVNWYWAE